MRATNYTPNLHLPQFLPTDKPAWMADINPAFLAIDTAVKDAADDADEALDAAEDALLDIAPVYSNAATYNVGDLVTYANRIYRCVVAITTPEEWTGAHWTLSSVASEIISRTGTLAAAVLAAENQIGSTDISAIGDGTITGALSTIDTYASHKPDYSNRATITSNSYTATEECYIMAYYRGAAEEFVEIQINNALAFSGTLYSDGTVGSTSPLLHLNAGDVIERVDFGAPYASYFTKIKVL